MTDNEDSGYLKKRKKDGPGCGAEASPHKTIKLDGKSSLKEDNYSPGSSQASNNSSQNSDSSSQHEESSQNSTLSSQEVAVEENNWTLEVQRGNAFTKLIEVFSEENPPGKITYNGNGYNLTELYDEFWITFYNSSQHSRGHGSKLPQKQNLTELELRSMAKIIKRGWEDERYWPKKLSPLFLEHCLFLGEHSNKIVKPDMLLEFIDPSEKSVIQKLRNVDQNVLDIFKKYSCENTVNVGEDIHYSCIRAANKIMVVDMRTIIDIWSKYLRNLMPIDKFNFLMKPTPDLDQHETEELYDSRPAHKLWHTFFYGWPEEKIRYYFRLLRNDKFGKLCTFCNQPFDAKHFISCCDKNLKTTTLKRHDDVLRILETKVREAIDRGNSYFPKEAKWEVVTMYENNFYEWPKEIGVSFQRKPHMLVYSTSPKKKLLLVEHKISWESNIVQRGDETVGKYDHVRVGLEENGFDVEYRVIVMGSRATNFPELYDLLEQIFEMKHSEISKTLEEISQAIIHIPYELYKKEILGQN